MANSDSSGDDSDVQLQVNERSEASIWDWFRVDCSARQPISKLAERYSQEQGLQEDVDMSQTLGFGNAVTASDIQRIYSESALKEQWREIFLILKLSLALISWGQTTVDAKLTVLKICETLGLKGELHFSTSSMEISFAGNSHLLGITADVVADKLMDATQIAKLLAFGRIETRAALMVLNSIIDRPLPYGWVPMVLNLQCLFSWAAIAAFMGDFEDLAAAALVSPVSIIGMLLCKRFRLTNIELCLVSIAVGIVLPLVWKFVVPVQICDIPRIWGAALLLWLPGTELINGAYEIKYGKIISGTAQLMCALIRCAFMGVGLTIGWQLFGRNTALAETHGVGGVKASLVPAETCAENGTPWYIIFGVYNFPMLFHCFASLNIRIRDMPYAFIVVYPSLLAFMALNVYAGLPLFVVNALGMFIAGNLAAVVEMFAGTPVNLSIVPMVIILAPGQPSVASVLSSMELDSAVSGVSLQPFWTNLALQGVSYAVGMCLALEIWRPILHKSDQVKARRAAETFAWSA